MNEAACPFTVVVDTREQIPYSFSSIRADVAQLPRRYNRNEPRPFIQVPTVRWALRQGDYSILGMENEISIERKSLADALGTLGKGRARFQRELQRLAGLRFAAVVVEADWSTIMGNMCADLTNDDAGGKPVVYSRLSAKTVFRSVITWQQRWPTVHWMFFPGRAMAEAYVYRTLERAWKEKQRAGRMATDGGKADKVHT